MAYTHPTPYTPIPQLLILSLVHDGGMHGVARLTAYIALHCLAHTEHTFPQAVQAGAQPQAQPASTILSLPAAIKGAQLVALPPRATITHTSTMLLMNGSLVQTK